MLYYGLDGFRLGRFRLALYELTIRFLDGLWRVTLDHLRRFWLGFGRLVRSFNFIQKLKSVPERLQVKLSTVERL